jgi:hypothetical protein
MLTPQMPVNGPLSWGLGIALERTHDATLFWHWGDNGSFKDFVAGDPAARRAIVVFTNGEGGHKVYQRLLQESLGRDLASLVWV